MMYAGTLSYFAQLQAQYELSALASKAKTSLLAAKGIFGYEPKIDYLFGLPRSISSGGIHLDIETTQVSRSLDNDNQKTIDFIIQTSPIGSALEHQVPEQMFNTDQANPTQGISTVKALQLANTQGQQIYKIDQTNIDTILPKLNLSDTIKQDIQNSINQGKYVITHTDNVSVPGWSGAGYAIIDPLTGDNAYLISGGENGGWIDIARATLIDVLTLIKPLTKVNPILGGLVSVLNSIASSIDKIINCMGFGLRGYAAITAFMIMTLSFVSMMTLLLFYGGAAIGLVYSTMFAGAMETMAAKYSDILDICQ